MKHDTIMVKVQSTGTTDGVLDGSYNGDTNGGIGGISPEKYSADPMVASAMMSPLANRLVSDWWMDWQDPPVVPRLLLYNLRTCNSSYGRHQDLSHCITYCCSTKFHLDINADLPLIAM